MLSGTAVFLRLLVGELWTPKLAKIFAYGKWLYPYRMLLHGASDPDQRCLKTRNSKDRCTFGGLKNVPLYFFGIRKRFGPINLFVIAHCAFMFKFIIGSHVTNECEPRLYIVYGESDVCCLWNIA